MKNVKFILEFQAEGTENCFKILSIAAYMGV